MNNEASFVHFASRFRFQACNSHQPETLDRSSLLVSASQEQLSQVTLGDVPRHVDR